ncbi:hypothetical protein GCM10009087_29200 [Sphingomonas oligophenolica]|uniref:Uncharacterized protein n=1 Tax=Sphingomonas oligophenolica TaxID=301154 RepID=A0ABU9YBF1_9SPHN
MAFICFNIVPAAGTSTGVGRPYPGLALFSPLERIVIETSLHDGLSSLGEPGIWRRRLHHLFGVRRKTRLADPRLETLRRVAVLLRHGVEPGAGEANLYAESGFTIAQYQALRSALCPAACR